MAISGVSPDYYAVLQVHPDADFEVIEAAYRQLMKKHHPDMAGDDPERIAAHLTRAKAINEAWRVLRDPEERRRYDIGRIINGTVRARPAPPPPPRSPRSPQPPAPPRSTTPPPRSAPPPVGSTTSVPAGAQAAAVVVTSPPGRAPGWLLAPFTLLSAAYYLLPGPYEWEAGSGREILAVTLLPVLGLASYALASGRLAPFIGHSLTTNIAAWAILALFATLSMWGSVLRIAAAGVPSLALLSGFLNPFLDQAHVPIWLAWGFLSCLSLIFAARLFVFGVLPTLGIIWFISR
ncbi:MAG: J domain-containing protein [Chloroflexi bacterium]|nr:J domain-containing protein [Chloroflexota bacterium]MBV9893034.1 J domain-containing protein [Chloroflexota bacterium]